MSSLDLNIEATDGSTVNVLAFSGSPNRPNRQLIERIDSNFGVVLEEHGDGFVIKVEGEAVSAWIQDWNSIGLDSWPELLKMLAEPPFEVAEIEPLPRALPPSLESYDTPRGEVLVILSEDRLLDLHRVRISADDSLVRLSWLVDDLDANSLQCMSPRMARIAATDTWIAVDGLLEAAVSKQDLTAAVDQLESISRSCAGVVIFVNESHLSQTILELLEETFLHLAVRYGSSPEDSAAALTSQGFTPGQYGSLSEALEPFLRAPGEEESLKVVAAMRLLGVKAPVELATTSRARQMTVTSARQILGSIIDAGDVGLASAVATPITRFLLADAARPSPNLRLTAAILRRASQFDGRILPLILKDCEPPILRAIALSESVDEILVCYRSLRSAISSHSKQQILAHAARLLSDEISHIAPRRLVTFLRHLRDLDSNSDEAHALADRLEERAVTDPSAVNQLLGLGLASPRYAPLLEVFENALGRPVEMSVPLSIISACHVAHIARQSDDDGLLLANSTEAYEVFHSNDLSAVDSLIDKVGLLVLGAELGHISSFDLQNEPLPVEEASLRDIRVAMEFANQLGHRRLANRIWREPKASWIDKQISSRVAESIRLVRVVAGIGGGPLLYGLRHPDEHGISFASHLLSACEDRDPSGAASAHLLAPLAALEVSGFKGAGALLRTLLSRRHIDQLLLLAESNPWRSVFRSACGVLAVTTQSIDDVDRLAAAAAQRLHRLLRQPMLRNDELRAAFDLIDNGWLPDTWLADLAGVDQGLLVRRMFDCRDERTFAAVHRLAGLVSPAACREFDSRFGEMELEQNSNITSRPETALRLLRTSASTLEIARAAAPNMEELENCLPGDFFHRLSGRLSRSANRSSPHLALAACQGPLAEIRHSLRLDISSIAKGLTRGSPQPLLRYLGQAIKLELATVENGRELLLDDPRARAQIRSALDIGKQTEHSIVKTSRLLSRLRLRAEDFDAAPIEAPLLVRLLATTRHVNAAVEICDQVVSQIGLEATKNLVNAEISPAWSENITLSAHAEVFGGGMTLVGRLLALRADTAAVPLFSRCIEVAAKLQRPTLFAGRLVYGLAFGEIARVSDGLPVLDSAFTLLTNGLLQDRAPRRQIDYGVFGLLRTCQTTGQNDISLWSDESFDRLSGSAGEPWQAIGTGLRANDPWSVSASVLSLTLTTVPAEIVILLAILGSLFPERVAANAAQVRMLGGELWHLVETVDRLYEAMG